jgi:hypothetical protein
MNCLRRPSIVIACALLLAAGAAQAQAAPPGEPPTLEPLPEIPLPPDLGDTELEPQITITQKDGEIVQEARVNGRIAWIKVTPRHGRPYFLVPDSGGYMFIRRDSLDSGLKVPLWVLFSF